MATCFRCHFENPEGSDECQQCAAKLSEALLLQLGDVCRECDSYNEPGSSVCFSCGHQLGASTSPSRAPEIGGSGASKTLPPGHQPFPEETAARLAASASESSPEFDSSAAKQMPRELSQPESREQTASQSQFPASPPGSAGLAPIEGVEAAGQEQTLEPGASPIPTSAKKETSPAGPQAEGRGASSVVKIGNLSEGDQAAVRQKGSTPLAPPPEPPPGWMAKARQRQQVPAGLVCKACAADNPLKARFCGSCGESLGTSPKKAEGRARLVVMRGEEEGRQIPLGESPVTVGRKVGTLTFPKDPYLAPHHLTLYFRNQELVLRDEGGQNGSYIRMRAPQRLESGDMFAVGERVLRFAGLKTVEPVDPLRYGTPLNSKRLMVVEEVLSGGKIGRVCKRPGPSLSIGRGNCDLNFPHDGFVSLRHAQLKLKADGTVELQDLESANGTYLRLGPKSERTLIHGDYVVLGQELLRVEISS